MAGRDQGFTLIEVLTVIVVTAIIGGISFSMLVRSADTYEIVTAQQRLATEAWTAVERITRETQNATAVSLPAAGTSGGTLALTDSGKPSCAACVDLSTGISYTLAGQNLVRTGNLSGAHVIASGATGFTATRSASGVVTVTLTLTEGAASATVSGTAIPFQVVDPSYRLREAGQ